MPSTQMPSTRFMMTTVIGLASVLWLTGVAAAEDAKAESKPQSGQTLKVDEPPPIDSARGPGPRGPGFGGPGFKGAGPFGPGAGQGRGPMRGPGDNGGPPQGPQPNQPGVGPGGMGPGGMGPGGMGRGGMGRGGPANQGGPGRFGHPGGSPRWPHDNWDALQKNDPEMYELLVEDNELDNRARQLAAQYRRAPIAGRTAIKKEIEQLLGQHFEIRQQRRVLELKRLEEELERLRSAIELRNKARSELVGKRITQLLGEQEGLDF